MHRDATSQRGERRRRALAPVALLAIVAGGAAAAVSAATAPAVVIASPALPAPDAAMRRDGLSLDEAIDRAQKRYRARVVRAEQTQSGGRSVYVLRLLSDEDGRVFTVRVDAVTGAMQ
jgi:uncharacterized membrane protein YkoI